MLALTREISPAIVSCELTHLDRTPIDLTRARAEHEAYETALRECGCTVQRLPADATMADSVFIEDTAVVLDELAIITRPGAPSRRGEIAAVREALREHRVLRELTAPATLDGGDVLRIGRRLLVGVGPRSNDEGRRQLAALVAPYGYDVEAVPFAGCLHLKTAATLVADDTVVFNPEWVDSAALGVAHAIAVDPAEPFAANAVRLGDVVIYPAEFPRTRAKLEAAGVRVRTVPAGELARAEGGVTCCSLLVSPAGRAGPKNPLLTNRALC
jgi:dimethylargininase